MDDDGQVYRERPNLTHLSSLLSMVGRDPVQIEMEAARLMRVADGYRRASTAIEALQGQIGPVDLDLLAQFSAQEQEGKWHFAESYLQHGQWEALDTLVGAGLLEVCFRACLNGDGRQRRYRYPQEPMVKRPTRAERLRNNGGSHTKSEWKELKKMFGNICVCCGASESDVDLHEDHVISVENGGDDGINNIQPLCQSCNSRKGTSNADYRGLDAGQVIVSETT